MTNYPISWDTSQPYWLPFFGVEHTPIPDRWVDRQKAGSYSPVHWHIFGTKIRSREMTRFPLRDFLLTAKRSHRGIGDDWDYCSSCLLGVIPEKNEKKFFFDFLNTVTHYVTLLIFEEKWGVVWVLRLEYLVFREAKTRFENWPASSVHTNSFLLDFCTSFFFLVTHNVWKLAKSSLFYILWKSEFLRQKCF